MQHSETITKIIPAIIKVMGEVESIDKNLEVGAGTRAAYKGVADKDVKLAIGKSMQANELIIIPTSIEETTEVFSWEETTDYGKKQKQSVFTKVKTGYRLFHASGEWIDLVGYGHGVDSQDKSAGKATTYALKNALLYSFLVPTGSIDDTDTTHSDNLPQKPANARKTVTKPSTQIGLHCDYHNTEMTERWSAKKQKSYTAHEHNGELCFGTGTKSEQEAWKKKSHTPVDETPIQRDVADTAADDFEKSLM